jgi:hypothetical protein
MLDERSWWMGRRTGIVIVALLAGAGDANADDALRTVSVEVVTETPVADPCRPFFADPEAQDEYAHPLNDEVCAIDIAALSDADVRYVRGTDFGFIDGNVVQLLKSATGSEAIVMSYRLLAIDSGVEISLRYLRSRGRAMRLPPRLGTASSAVCKALPAGKEWRRPEGSR